MDLLFLLDLSAGFITDFMKLWLVLWGLFNIKPVKDKKVYMITGFAEIIVLTSLYLAFHDTKDPTRSVYSMFLVIIVMCFIFEGKFLKNLAYSFLTYFLVFFLDVVVIECNRYIAVNFASINSHNILLSIFNNTVNIFTILFVVLIKKRRVKSNIPIKISRRIYILLFGGVISGVTLLAAISTIALDPRAEKTKIVIFIVTAVVITCYNAACILMIILMESRDNYRTLSIINKNIVESQQKYYTLVNEKQLEIRSIRHEMKNHLTCINGLYRANKLSEMEQYLKELVNASEITDDLFDTGNDIVNAILNDAQSKYQKENIRIRLQGVFPLELKISAMDLCVIFANIISNAVEAIQCMQRNSDEISYIDVSIKNFKEDLFITVRNPVAPNAKLDTKSFHTSKMNKDLHGFGVKNVLQRVEKYNGTVKYGQENNEIFVNIEMKITS